ncbi:MAG: hypothetical protein ACFFB2_07620 [Promethearchaeota archaeon]
MNTVPQNKPRKGIALKISCGLFFTITLIVVHTSLTREIISFELLGMAFFFIGGIFFIIGGTRDFFESLIISRLRGKKTVSPNTIYLHGFGKAGEDIIAGILLIALSLICWIIQM